MTSYKNAVLSFRSAQHDLKMDSPLNALEVYVSTNFDGSNVTKANWKKLEAKFPSLSTPPRAFISSGAIDYLLIQEIFILYLNILVQGKTKL